MKENIQHIIPTKVYSILGIGFGPSSIAQMIALSEAGMQEDCLFFEEKNEFAWHPGMLFHDANMQVSFFKDLVTFRNPTSPFSFLNYLHNKKRLVDFANMATLYPSRVEFNDYLKWCADQFHNYVQYNTTVLEIKRTDLINKQGPLFEITVQSGNKRTTVFSQAIFYGGGIKPKLPKGIEPSSKIFHCHSFLKSFNKSQVQPKSTIAVVGAGQSAAEVISYLHEQLPGTKVVSLVRSFGMMPADASPFVNQVFDPDSVDLFFNANDTAKSEIQRRHSSTNYAAVDIEIIKHLYQCWYQDKVNGKSRIEFKRLTELVSCVTHAQGINVQYKSLEDNTVHDIEADYMVCATGFEPNSVLPLLSEELKDMVIYDDYEYPKISRNYALTFESDDVPPIYVPAMSEHTHGFSATLISNMSTRSGEIVESLKSHLVHLSEQKNVRRSSA